MIHKSIAQILLGALLVAGVNYSGRAQATKPTTPATQPTPSMQEQYDKLHGNTPKKTTTQPSKSKTTTKPQTTQKPAKTAPAPKPEVMEKPKAASGDEGGFKFKVGLRGGVNYSTFSVPSLEMTTKRNSIIGYHGGIILSLGGKSFSVQPEILYSQIGYEETSTLAQVNLKGQRHLNTLTVPILFKFSAGGDIFKFFVNAGGYGSYVLNGTSTIISPSSNETKSIEFKGNKDKIEYGAVGGAGISFGLGRAELLIEGRYFYGLGNNRDIDKDVNSFVRNIQGSIGILIPLGGK
jgi:hypothetical protein